MTREEAKELLPIIKEWSEGKTLQHYSEEYGWIDWLNFINFNEPPSTYRIKPEPKYRPFKTQEECWNEMLKHQPFSWIKDNEDGHYTMVTMVDDTVIRINGNNDWFLDEITNNYTFVDGTPFGIKED